MPSMAQHANLYKKTINFLQVDSQPAKTPAQFLEVMECEGGCITGPCGYNDIVSGKRLFDKQLANQTITYDDIEK